MKSDFLIKSFASYVCNALPLFRLQILSWKAEAYKSTPSVHQDMEPSQMKTLAKTVLLYGRREHLVTLAASSSNLDVLSINITIKSTSATAKKRNASFL